MNKLLPILCFLIIASCSKEIPSDQLVERNGIYYEVNSQTPFSGRVVSYHENGQLKWKRNYKDGNRDGLSELYGEDGQLRWIFCHQKGEEIDMSDCDPKLQELREEIYKKKTKDGTY